jgi:kumamolisin
MTLSKHLLAALAASLAGVAIAAPYPHAGKAPAAVDLGDSAAVEATTRITVTVALKLSNSEQLDPLVQAIYTPGSPQYRQFLTPEQFRARFGPSAATLAAVTREFTAAGLDVTRTATAQLHVSGTAAQLEREFGVQLHTFQALATADTPSYVYRKPMSAPRVPDAIAGSVRAVLGLDTRPHLTPHLQASAQKPGQSGDAVPAPRISNQTNTTDPPGQWTVIDYAEYYDVDPLYRQGLSGDGHTLAIVTFASMTESDAYYYWSSLGLNVHPNRINVVNVDGGPGAPCDACGSIETTIDVQQSGGLAPGSKIIIYQAPNTNQGFVDAFAAAFDANRADTVSVSWGEWEGFDGTDGEIYFQNGPVTNPTNGQQSTIFQALSDLFTQAAIQGQSMFASAGDYGAYDELNSLPTAPSPGQPYSYNGILSVDDPAVQQYVTAAGGTTLPGTQVYTLSSGATITINIPTEQAWNWEYLAPLCIEAFGAPANCEFPIGTGGGVSYLVDRPFYQWFVPNMANTVPGQVLYQLTPTVQELYGEPGHFPGRNVPDISTNADPQTGYIVYYTSSVSGTLGEYVYGGTSFVDPELNGVTQLFVQAFRGRVGFLNPALYQIDTSPGAYRGRSAPYRDITQGNNWYWNAGPGYDQTTGVGVPNVANLLDALSYYIY